MTSAPAPFCPHCGFDLMADAPVEMGNTSFDLRQGLTVNGVEIRLTAAERILVQSLLKARGGWVSDSCLSGRMGSEGFPGKVVSCTVYRIRLKLRHVGAERLIEAGNGFGYRWNARDSGRLPKGEDRRASCAASQSGGAAASPEPSHD